MKMSGKKRNEQRQPDGEMMKLHNQGFNWQGWLVFDLNLWPKQMKKCQQKVELWIKSCTGYLIAKSDK